MNDWDKLFNIEWKNSGVVEEKTIGKSVKWKWLYKKEMH